jgi:hypothetical protein
LTKLAKNNSSHSDNHNIDTNIVNTTNNTTYSISFNLSNPRGRPKSSVKDNKKIKEYRKEINQSKLKAEHKIKMVESINTLKFFMSEEPGIDTNSNFDNRLESKASESHITDIEYGHSYSNIENIYGNIYKSHDVSKNSKVNSSLKRIISLKDLMFYLERNKQTSYHQVLLFKIVSKING